jgi:hypothetical protein
MCLCLNNRLGTKTGADLTFTTGPAVPAATTLAASSVSSSSATPNGTVSPNGAATTAYFQYGPDTNYGSYSATNTVAATNGTLSASNLISNLTPGTTYHFQLVASNSVGANAGTDMLFTTLAQVVNFSLEGAVPLSGGAFQFGFTTQAGLSFTVLATTNLALLLTSWTLLGALRTSPKVKPSA